QIDAVVRWLAWSFPCVVAGYSETLDEPVFQFFIDVWPAEVRHLRRKVMQLVWQYAADLDCDLIDVAYKEADFLVPRERQQGSLSEKLQRLRIRFNLGSRDVGLAGNVAAGSLNAVSDRDVDVSSDRSEQFETVRGIAAFIGGYIGQAERLRFREDV